MKLAIGSKVTFSRGMFGSWPGTIRQIYKGHVGQYGLPGELMAVVSFARANGTSGKKRCRLSSLALIEEKSK